MHSFLKKIKKLKTESKLIEHDHRITTHASAQRGKDKRLREANAYAKKVIKSSNASISTKTSIP